MHTQQKEGKLPKPATTTLYETRGSLTWILQSDITDLDNNWPGEAFPTP